MSGPRAFRQNTVALVETAGVVVAQIT